MTYSWRFATPEEFIPVCKLFRIAKLGDGFIDIRRRITIPLFLRQLIVFYHNGVLCGFVTFAFLSEAAEKHMPTTGIYPTDWRSGPNFWVVDYAVQKDSDGYAMLRAVTKGLGVKKARYFRKKNHEIREVRAA